LGHSGNTGEAKSLMEQLQKQSEHGHVAPTSLAYALIGLNRSEDALRMMEREVAERGYISTDYGVCPEFDQFRSNPRFKALLKQMNLPE
jgi:hypothetical protein